MNIREECNAYLRTEIKKLKKKVENLEAELFECRTERDVWKKRAEEAAGKPDLSGLLGE